MNKRAFVLMETIVVIVVISIALLTIFKSYNKILAKVKTENKYDTSEYIYMTNYVKKYIQNNCTVSSDDILNTVIEHYNNGCVVKNATGISKFKIKKIYILNNINSVEDIKLKEFDGYMIDYIKKLDVSDKDELIIVEYKKDARDDKGEYIYTTMCPKTNPSCKPLTETYIASLEWD